LRIKPVSKKSRDDFVPIRGTTNIKDKDLVLFEASGQKRRAGFREARIIELIGSVDDPKAASLISLHEHNIPMGFDDDVLAQADALALPEIGGPREDLRDVPLLTIDPDDAKDFDDAIYAKKESDGWTVWVAIADVAAFVTPGSPLDKAAFKKGNSVYLPDRVEPMLPHALSSNLCSLRPDEDRACMAVRMKFNAQGEKVGHTFKRGIMRSIARLTYAQAQAAFEGRPGDIPQDSVAPLADLYAFYKVLRDARERRSPLEIDMPERRVRVGDDGQIKTIEVRERFDAHKLVEEFMIQANVAAAEALDSKGMDLIYRVHDAPGQERLLGLSDFLPVMGLKWAAGERATPQRFNRLMQRARDKDLGEVVGMAVLRTQSQAIYTPKNGGHFGLNLTQYARAMAAERDCKDRYIAAYLSDRVGAKFPARINGVTKFGLFVTLDETGADGLVPARNLGDEFFVFDEKSRSLIGRDTGGTYKFGARVTVRLTEAIPVSGGLTFEMISPPEKGKKPSRHSGAHNRKRASARRKGSKPKGRR